MKTIESRAAYVAPEVEVIEVKVEQGFAATGDDGLNDMLNGGGF